MLSELNKELFDKYFLQCKQQCDNVKETAKWFEDVINICQKNLQESPDGNLKRFINSLEVLHSFKPLSYNLNDPIITIGKKSDLSEKNKSLIHKELMKLSPWRKGPYLFFDEFIDCEWRSDWKWDRVSKYISPLKDKVILDIGCGNGYHCIKMANSEAKLVVGIDPSYLFLSQFLAITNNIDIKTFILPMTFEQMPEQFQRFDTIFSMGVLYHRKSPFEHLIKIRHLLKADGEFILETFIIEGEEKGRVLVPDNRYAKMNNVWFIPTIPTMLSWLKKAGFKNSKFVESGYTTIEEQRQTKWMQFESLSDFLDPQDSLKTIEGHQAPLRGIFICKK